MSAEFNEELNKILDTWLGLNSVLATASETLCEQLLQVELTCRKRMQVAMRIQGRRNRMRAARERIEIRKKVNAK